MPGKEIERRFRGGIGDVFQKIGEKGRVALAPAPVFKLAENIAARIAAHEDIGVAFFQVIRGHAVQFVILRRRALPVGRAVGLDVRVEAVRLVPDLPVFYAPCVPVCPSAVIMPHDMFADIRPFAEIGGREHVVFFRRVLYGAAEAVHDFDPVLHKRLDVEIGEREIVGGFVVRVRAEIAEDVVHVHVMPASVGVGGVVQAHNGRTQRQKARQHRAVVRLPRGVIEAVQRPDRFDRFCEIGVQIQFVVHFSD